MAMAVRTPSPFGFQFKLFRLSSNLTPFPHLSSKSHQISIPFKFRLTQCAKKEVKPAADPKLGVAIYKPRSYDVLVSDAADSLSYALSDGKTRVEVEFPPLPSNVSSYKGSSDEFNDANVQLVLAIVKKLQEKKETRACIVFSDKPEKRRASTLFRTAFDMIDGLTIGTLEDVPIGPMITFFRSLSRTLDFDFEEDDEGCWQSDKPPSIYIFINCSSADLSSIEKYVEKFAMETPVVLFNLELDTLRGDLGLFGFPSKELHYRFLSQFIPVFYIRTQDYSKTVAVAPYVLNYSGALLRLYPGPWQVMLKQTDGSFACIAESEYRFTLGETKQELLRVLGLQEEKGSTLEFLRRGFKTSTWWEDDVDLEKSSAWRS
ncbi:hypothetical protein DM860_017145 [Cuscuta australis]|uniref:DUF1995 domain-containing protein n=2 Tax=Cuscuta sect. Cleistogrammica TaxID=1824901 RepID=A0A328DBM9_9ASTE|nr:hypothetical protein DM860_017145 [Cuscuta australis]